MEVEGEEDEGGRAQEVDEQPADRDSGHRRSREFALRRTRVAIRRGVALSSSSFPRRVTENRCEPLFPAPRSPGENNCSSAIREKYFTISIFRVLTNSCTEAMQNYPVIPQVSIKVVDNVKDGHGHEAHDYVCIDNLRLNSVLIVV